MSDEAWALVDQALFIPMTGMVQSLNVSVEAATLLFIALRQRESTGLVPSAGEGIPEGKEQYEQILLEWADHKVAQWCREEGRNHPTLTDQGEIAETLQRSLKIRD